MQYGKIISGATTVTFPLDAPVAFVDVKGGDTCPDGYLPIEKVLPKPTPEDGYTLQFTYTNTGTVLRKEYAVVPKGSYKMPRTFSKLKAVAVLMSYGYWDECKQFITDEGLYDLYLAAQDFREDNEYFKKGLAKIKAQLGLTDEQVEAILAQCVAD